MKILKISIMVNAWKWLEENYPQKEERSKVGKIFLTEQLEGEIDLSDFTYYSQGAEVLISLNVDETKFEIKNLPEKAKIIKLVNAQEWLEENYPKDGVCKIESQYWWKKSNKGKKRKEVTELDISDKNLEGDLDLSGFINLKELKCYGNKLTSLNISDCSQLTSGNKEIDNFIQQQQLSAIDEEKTLFWIPYEQFANIEHIADGGFGQVYKATWGKYESGYDRIVALKSLNNSQNMTIEFCREITNHKLFSRNESDIVNCYGISQDPKTKNYIMVMEYIKGGSLREHLQNGCRRLDLSLSSIAFGLKDIHSKGLVHRDFHPGNILKLGDEYTNCYITDLGLARPASETDDNKLYGIIPYVAPEILRGKDYTQKSDIYSFGIIVYEVLSGLPPYPNRDYDIHLALDICRGLRPCFQIKIPPLLEKLINKCWNVDPSQRPTSSELYKNLNELYSEKNTEFYQQYRETEEFNQTLPEEIRNPKYRLHPGAIMHSGLINTKQITQLLQHGSKDLELDLNNFSLNELTLQEDPQEQSSAQAQIQIPPK